MKIRRFCALFFAMFLLLSLPAPALAADAPQEPPQEQGEEPGIPEEPQEPDEPAGFHVDAKAALLIDPETEEILYEQNIHDRLYPASVTKIMTCLLVLEAIDDGRLSKSQVLTASETAISEVPPDGSNVGIKVGEELTVEELLYCIMLSSANEGCNMLAEAIDGSISAFVARMNQKARDLGCEDTNFCNTNGLPDVGHYTTAWDLYLITKEARTYPDFMPLVDTIYHQVPATNMAEPRELYTTNYLISSYKTNYYIYQGAHGIKTGSTSAAGYCLVSSADRDDRSLLTVVLGADRVVTPEITLTYSFIETSKLFDHGFDDFDRKVLLAADELVGEVDVELSQQQNTVKVHPSQEIERLVPADLDPVKDVDRITTYESESVEAPVVKGQVMGTITLKSGDTVYGTVDLLADEDVAVSRLLVFRRDLLDFLHKPTLWIVLGASGGAIILLVILRAIFKSRRRSSYNRRQAARRSGSNGYRGRRR
ncbi:MAG: D-alanyl-D-alanine carboxypeptidase [Oscillospiraceae bacterium]|jgi:D-alanyl-D-alanine carboxypeptidase (penicillin-binding protein 5/6)|nr:D-alanyl-D-alanine carboxypeptidase [Oscillospiraceae bacterium]